MLWMSRSVNKSKVQFKLVWPPCLLYASSRCSVSRQYYFMDSANVTFESKRYWSISIKYRCKPWAEAVLCLYVCFFCFLHCCPKDFCRWEQYQAWSVVLWAKDANNARVLLLKYCQLARLNPILSLGLSTNGALQQIFNSNCL